MNALPMLIRRELWEHRALWVAPLVVPALIVIAALTGRFNFGMPMSAPQAAKVGLTGVMQLSMTGFQYVIVMFVLFFYLLDCLFTERRDRSILFWKSLPVSDTATVLSKLIVALVIVPLGVYVVAIVTHLLFVSIVMLRGGVDLGVPIWDTVMWIKVLGVILIAVVVAVLWYAPIAGYLLLVSVWARRAPFLWAVLPFATLMIAEHLAFDTGYVARFVRYRLMGWMELLTPPNPGALAERIGERRVTSMDSLFSALDVSHLFTSLHLWLGLVAAAVLVYAAIRTRRVRDDA